MKPTPYDMDKEEDVERWFSEMEGYLKVSNGGKGFISDGTDIEGRKFAMDGFKALNQKRSLFTSAGKLRAALRQLGGAIMSVKQHNTDRWMVYIQDEIDKADAVLVDIGEKE